MGKDLRAVAARESERGRRCYAAFAACHEDPKKPAIHLVSSAFVAGVATRTDALVCAPPDACDPLDVSRRRLRPACLTASRVRAYAAAPRASPPEYGHPAGR